MAANQFKLAEAFTEFTIKGFAQFKAKMISAKNLAISAMKPFRALGGMIRKLFTPLGIGLGALGAGAGILGLLKLSSAAKETKAAFDSIFGESADDANAWVEQMAKAFRRNETNLRRSLLRFQTLFRGFGAETKDAFELAKLALQAAIDIEAFQNLAPGAAVDKVTSGLAGMMRPLLDIGINVQQGALDAELMAMGFEHGAQNVDRLTKSMVALRVITATIRKQGVIGQAARELSGFAAQFRSMTDSLKTLGERVGDLLVPVFKEVAFLASAIADVMGRVATEILPAVVAFFSPLATIIRTIATGLQGLDLQALSADMGKAVIEVLKLFADLFLLAINAGGKLFVIWAKLAGAEFVESMGKLLKAAPLAAAQQLDRAFFAGPPGPEKEKKSRRELVAESTFELGKELGKATNELIKDFFGRLPRRDDKGPAGKTAEEITKENIEGAEGLLASLIAALKGTQGAGKGGPSFFTVGFAALQDKLQSQISKGESAQIKLLEQGNAQREQMKAILQEGLDNPQPAPVGA